jgi:hypothetical protein
MPMRASLLVGLGTRAALSALPFAGRFSLHGEMTVTALRTLATEPTKLEQKKAISEFFGIGSVESSLLENRIEKIVKSIDSWLLYDRDTNPNGFPPALRIAIAHRSPEVYLLLMILADRILTEQGQDENPTTESWKDLMLGLASALHWFCRDQKKAVRQILERLPAKGLTPQCFYKVLASESETSRPPGMLQILAPADLRIAILDVTPDNLSNSDLFDRVVRSASEGSIFENNRNHVWPVVQKIAWEKEFLIYAQREYLSVKFENFDPADASAWEDHNRPWDYDHLLPHAIFRGLHKAEFLKVCQLWGGTIGNFHILPFEENRSRSDNSAESSFQDRSLIQLKQMCLIPDDLSAFSITKDDVKNIKEPEAVLKEPKAVLNFVKATQRRIHAVYENWYSSLDIGFLANGGSEKKPI